VVREVRECLLGGRVSRVHQPAPLEVVLVVSRGGTRRLLLSAHAEEARAHLIEETPPNPERPPVFCQVLRKHLEGLRLVEVAQPDLERVLLLDFAPAAGAPPARRLVAEFMGRHSNIILLADGVIVDAVKRYSHAVSRHREVLPGRPYVPPPEADKLDPCNPDEETLSRRLLSHPLDTPLAAALQRSVAGLSTVLAREVVFRAGLPPDLALEFCGAHELRLLRCALERMTADVREGRFRPTLVLERGHPVEFAALDLTHCGHLDRRHRESVSLLLEEYFGRKKRLEALRREKQSLLTVINRHRKGLGAQVEALRAALEEDPERYRVYGELLMAHLHRVTPGSDSVTLENFYDGNLEVSVPLRPELSPVANAQHYFKRYRKLKRAREESLEKRERLREELAYLEGLELAVELAETLEELADVRRELEEQGYLPREAEIRRDRRVLPGSGPLRFLSSDGLEILVGKNNRQNEYLWRHVATDGDLWLHAKDLPGAHVIVRTGGRPVPPTTLEEAASLAAYFSRGRGAAKVPVDYTLRCNVYKPKGARPGMVLYEDFRTVVAAPDPDLVARLAGPSASVP
jgi:predicted ribosome quality control (RQC) complex YloA/Tae2 family protein